MIRRIAAVLFAALLLAPAGAQAVPDSFTVVIGGHFVFGDDDPFPLRVNVVAVDTVPIPLQVVQGNNVLFANRDIEGHNITALDVDASGAPLFGTPTIGQNESITLVTAHLDAGDYPFVCTIHNEFMQGTLTVI